MGKRRKKWKTATQSPMKSAKDSAEVFQKNAPKQMGMFRNGNAWAGHTSGRCSYCVAKLFIKAGDLEIYAGSRTSTQALYKQGFESLLAIDLTGNTDYNHGLPLIQSFAGARELLGSDIVDVFPAMNVPIIEIDWPDHGVPDELSDPWWWEMLAAKISTFQGAITVNCEGGHGRTGTFLVCLCHHLGLIPKNIDPVKWVRKHGCDSMVESHEQIDFIKSVTGRNVRAKPSDNWGYGAWGTGGQRWVSKAANTTPKPTVEELTSPAFPEKTKPTINSTFTSRVSDEVEKIIEAYDSEFDPKNPPKECDAQALRKLEDQRELDNMWEKYIGGSWLHAADIALCRWLARRFYDEYPNGDIMSAEYQVETQQWTGANTFAMTEVDKVEYAD